MTLIKHGFQLLWIYRGYNMKWPWYELSCIIRGQLLAMLLWGSASVQVVHVIDSANKSAGGQWQHESVTVPKGQYQSKFNSRYVSRGSGPNGPSCGLCWSLTVAPVHHTMMEEVWMDRTEPSGLASSILRRAFVGSSWWWWYSGRGRSGDGGVSHGRGGGINEYVQKFRGHLSHASIWNDQMRLVSSSNSISSKRPPFRVKGQRSFCVEKHSRRFQMIHFATWHIAKFVKDKRKKRYMFRRSRTTSSAKRAYPVVDPSDRYDQKCHTALVERSILIVFSKRGSKPCLQPKEDILLLDLISA